MSADDAREELEAVIWRCDAGKPCAPHVEAILAAADAYANAVLSDRLDHLERAKRQAGRRAVLADAVGGTP